MKALIRFHEEARQRNLQEGNTRELLEALLDTAELVRSFIELCRTTNYPDDEGLLEAFHKVIHSQKHMYDPGPEDQSEFSGKPKEEEASGKLNTSIGLLRIQVFDKISFLLDENTVSASSIRTSLEQFLLEREADEVVQGAEELPNLPPFLALVVSLSQYIDLYHFLHIALLDHRDKELFITNKGNMGMAFQGLNINDAVAIWEGCPSPFIVRKVERDGRSLYRLHGPAYVDGIMNGEAWVEEENELRVFELI
ncbi:MAG: hypothetical protein M1839_004915 [Geoglossum umbratile]|nr:MAG: hypothetical protein M1839_004915 [Geoglossum umbratile]